MEVVQPFLNEDKRQEAELEDQHKEARLAKCIEKCNAVLFLLHEKRLVYLQHNYTWMISFQ
jgi:hypothetical protein